MKKKLVLFFATFVSITLTVFAVTYAGETNEKTIIVSEEKVDVTGDGKKDLILIKGTPFEEGGQFLKSITLEVIAAKDKTFKINLEGGYDPSTLYRDMNHDGVKDIFISIPTGGSGGLSNFYLYSFKDFITTDLTVPQPLAISSQFEEGYKASITIEETGESYSFDLSDRKEDYDRIGLYKNGKLNEPTELMILPFGTLKPVIVKENLYGFIGSQRISGAYNADGIANVESIWFYDKGKWNLISTRVKNLNTQ